MQFTGLSLLTWLIVAWAVVTTVLVLLMIYRGMIGMHQEDQIFLSSSSRGFEAETAAADARAAKLQPYIRASIALSAVLAASVAGVWITQAIQRF